MKDINNRQCLNVQKDANNLYFLYEGNIIDSQLKLEDINNNIRGERIFYIESGDKYDGSWKNDTYEDKGI